MFPEKTVEATLLALKRELARLPDASEAPEAAALLAQLARSMAADGNPRRHDPIREVLARLGDKWSPLILLILRAGSFRHATLRRLVGMLATEGEISQRVLTLKLRQLEHDGLVSREDLGTVPPAVRYALTNAGRGLVTQLDALMAFGREHGAALRKSSQSRAGGAKTKE